MSKGKINYWQLMHNYKSSKNFEVNMASLIYCIRMDRKNKIDSIKKKLAYE